MLSEIINGFITTKEADSYMPTDKFRMSYAGRCRLMRFWRRQGRPVTDKFDAKVKGTFEIGNIFHTWIQDTLKATGHLVGAEIKIEDEHRLGHADAIVKSENGLILYDFKTVNSKKFFVLNKNGDKKGDVHYAFQLASYLLMLQNFYDNIIDSKIAYICKDDFSILEVSIFDIEQNLLEKTQQDWDILINAWINQKEPEPNPLSWECNYCSYRTGCEQRK